MKNSFLIIVMTSMAIFTGCATRLVAHSDHDASQNFSTYRTFSWMGDQPMIAPPGEVARVSPLNRRRIEQAIEKELSSKGFQKVNDRTSADFVVTYSVGARDRLDSQSFPAPYGGSWRWGYPYFGRDVDVQVYREGTLAVDVFDGKTHEPVWHGWATGRVTEKDIRHAAERIPPAVASILENFPPK